MIRTQTRWVCDRCGKLFKLDESDGGELIAKSEEQVILISVGDDVFARFRELCEDCQRVVGNCLQRIVLEKSKKKKSSKEEEESLPQKDEEEFPQEVEGKSEEQESEVIPEHEPEKTVLGQPEEKPDNPENSENQTSAQYLF